MCKDCKTVDEFMARHGITKAPTGMSQVEFNETAGQLTHCQKINIIKLAKKNCSTISIARSLKLPKYRVANFLGLMKLKAASQAKKEKNLWGHRCSN